MMQSASPDHQPSRDMPVSRPPLWLLALITLSGTMAMHIFVPALHAAGSDLGASASTMQLTVSAYIVGLAIGQLFYGPISDHFGRRRVLIFGTVVYAVSSVASVFTPTVELLIAERFLQAIGGCAGLVLGRAIVRDGSGGAGSIRRLSLLNLMTIAGPGLSPLLGSALVAITGWRSIFYALSLLGFANLLLIVRLLPETAGGTGHDMTTMLRSYARLIQSRAFLGYAIGGGAATSSIYAYIGAAPYIFITQLHRPTHEVGMYLAINMIGAWFGSFTTSRLAERGHTRRLLVVGNLLSCLGALVFLAFAAAGSLSVVTTVLPMLVLSYGAGIASPAALGQALEVDPSIAGSASGLYGSLQMLIGAICAALSGFGGNPGIAAGVVLVAAGGVAQLSFLIARKS